MAGGLGEERGGVAVTSCRGVVEAGGEGGQARFGEDLLGQVGQRLAHCGSLPLQ